MQKRDSGYEMRLNLIISSNKESIKCLDVMRRREGEKKQDFSKLEHIHRLLFLARTRLLVFAKMLRSAASSLSCLQAVCKGSTLDQVWS
jgi:hypothetical protein